MRSTSARPQIVLTSIGTDGDIYPFLKMGSELLARGYDVTLAANGSFSERAAQAGLQFHALVAKAEFDAVLSRPEFWHPIKGPIMLARWGARLLSRDYQNLSDLIADKPTVMIASVGVLAARLLQEKRDVPLVSVILQPWMIPSIHAPPVMMGGLTLPRWAPRILGKLYFRLLDRVGASLLGGELTRLRQSLGLPRMRRMFQWWLSPELILGMFPGWFGQPQPDWPRQIKLTGFPLGVRKLSSSLPPGTVDFCRAGSPPIAFTFGTGMMHAAELFQKGIEACRMLGRRAILLTRFRSQLPNELPPFVHHCEFAPFPDIFPLCAAVVHHGGIGTVSEGLAAGIPQLILPFSFDQLDNATRVKKLGAGNWLNARDRSPRALAEALKDLLDGEHTDSSPNLSSRFADRTGIQRAVDCVEEFIAQSEVRKG